MSTDASPDVTTARTSVNSVRDCLASPWALSLLVIHAAGLYLFAINAYATHATWIDDAFITYRYVENLAHGHGIVWNVGEAHTEGYTSPLHVMLLLPAVFVRLSPHVMTRLASVLIVLAGMPLFAMVMSRRACFPPRSAAMVPGLAIPGLWIGFHATAVHALSGLETCLALLMYCVWILRVNDLSSRVREDGGGDTWRMAVELGVLGFLVALVRSEAGAIAVVGYATLLLFGETRRLAVRAGLCFGGLLVLYLLWKLMYFGHLLPNPYYHKVGTGSGVALPGRASVTAFLNHHLWLVILFPVAVAAGAIRKWRDVKPVEVLCVGGALFHVLFFLRVEPVMDYQFRFLFHSMPFWFVLAIRAFRRLSGPMGESDSPGASWMMRGLGAGAAFLIVCVMAVRNVPGDVLYLARHPRSGFQTSQGATRPHRAIGSVLGELDLPYETLVNGTEAGLIPYLSRLRAIDMTGLNDNVIVHGTPEERRAYLDANPFAIDFTLSTSGMLDDFAHAPQVIAAVPDEVRESSTIRFGEREAGFHYAGTFDWGVDARRRFFVLWVRHDAPDAGRIVEALASVSDSFSPWAGRWVSKDSLSGYECLYFPILDGPYDEERVRRVAIEEPDVRADGSLVVSAGKPMQDVIGVEFEVRGSSATTVGVSWGSGSSSMMSRELTGWGGWREVVMPVGAHPAWDGGTTGRLTVELQPGGSAGEIRDVRLVVAVGTGS